MIRSQRDKRPPLSPDSQRKYNSRPATVTVTVAFF